MKYGLFKGNNMENCVAPYTGAWIEIRLLVQVNHIGYVAPYTGAWIEIKIES